MSRHIPRNPQRHDHNYRKLTKSGMTLDSKLNLRAVRGNEYEIYFILNIDMTKMICIIGPTLPSQESTMLGQVTTAEPPANFRQSDQRCQTRYAVLFQSNQPETTPPAPEIAMVDNPANTQPSGTSGQIVSNSQRPRWSRLPPASGRTSRIRIAEAVPQFDPAKEWTDWFELGIIFRIFT